MIETIYIYLFIYVHFI